MNWDRIEGNWKQFKGTAKQQWGKLTDDQLDVIAGKRDHLVGKIQEAYGISKEVSEKQVSDWLGHQQDTEHPKAAMPATGPAPSVKQVDPKNPDDRNKPQSDPPKADHPKVDPSTGNKPATGNQMPNNKK